MAQCNLCLDNKNEQLYPVHLGYLENKHLCKGCLTLCYKTFKKFFTDSK